jgi:hypothetical protein
MIVDSLRPYLPRTVHDHERSVEVVGRNGGERRGWGGAKSWGGLVAGGRVG